MAFSSSAYVAVEKATSDLLIGPDWTMNIDICDSINSGHWQAKDVVKAVKKRLHKSPDVQLLSLTLLETMLKNCGDNVRFQIADRNILEDMVKIVKKKPELKVRDKILVLLDSWQEAFGGPRGRYPQYYRAYEDLMRFGVVFPKSSTDAAPIFTPPATNSTVRPRQPRYGLTQPTIQPFESGLGMSRTASRRLDETMATEMEGLSLSSLDAMRGVMELLRDMLQAIIPGDCAAMKDEVIIELVSRCRNNQKKLIQMLTTTGDEQLLCRGLELNDEIQGLLAKHNALASGSPIPTERTYSTISHTEASSSTSYPTEGKYSSPVDFSPSATSVVSSEIRTHLDDEDDNDDEFAQLARRHSKPRPVTTAGTSRGSESLSTSIPSNALTLPPPPATVRASQEQDMIDLLSMTLSTTAVSPDTFHKSSPSMHLGHTSPNARGNLNTSQTCFGNQGQVQFDNYVAPWAQTQSSVPDQPQSQLSQYQYQTQQHSEFQQPVHPRSQSQISQQIESQPELPALGSQVQPQQFEPQSCFQGLHLPAPGHFQQFQHQAHLSAPLVTQNLQCEMNSPDFQYPCQPHSNQQLQPPQAELDNQYSKNSVTYPPPPWAVIPEFSYNQSHRNVSDPSLAPRSNTAAWHTSVDGDLLGQPTYRAPVNQIGQKQPFVPTYRLFEDLDVFRNADGKLKMTNTSSSSSLSGVTGPGMVGGRQ